MKFRFGIIILFILSWCQSFANIKVLSEKVVKMRSEVELLNDEYKIEKEKVSSDLKILNLQNAEVETKLREEEIRNKQVSAKLSQLKNQLSEGLQQETELAPVLGQHFSNLKTYIENSIPFKHDERLAAVEQLERRYELREISAVKATNLLWSLYDDEKRLARETSLHRQTIDIEGTRQLADIAKVGMKYLYFKTELGQTGLIKMENGKWKYSYFSEARPRMQVEELFAGLKKQIRVGFYHLPTDI